MTKVDVWYAPEIIASACSRICLLVSFLLLPIGNDALAQRQTGTIPNSTNRSDLIDRDSAPSLSFDPDANAAASRSQQGLLDEHFNEMQSLRNELNRQPENYTEEEIINISVYERCNRGVVNISTRTVQVENFFAVTAAEGSGSGSIINRNGLVLTNYHVIENARDINVTLFDGETFPARVIGVDPDNDIAVLKIDAPPSSLFPILWGDASRLRVGQRILAIGNPFGLERTLSDGIVSSLNRQIPSKTRRSMRSIIQIDASLNQGNSGGPLIDSRGLLIGMNTAIATSTGDNAGIGFAIPVNTIRRIVPQLVENGRVIRPTSGIEGVFERQDGSLVVVKTTPGGPADLAGVQGYKLVRKVLEQNGVQYQTFSTDASAADIIVAADGKRISTADDLLAVIENHRPGETMVLTVLRNGQQLDVRIRLGDDI